MASKVGGRENLPGYGRRIEAEILCIKHVPLSFRSRTTRRTPAGIYRFGHLRPLQTTARLQCTQSDGIRRLRLARRAICYPDRTASGHHYHQQYRPLPRATRQNRFLFRLEP